MTVGTALEYARIWASFERFAAASGTLSVGGTDARLCRAFATAPTKGGLAPSTSTSRFRLTVVRDAFIALMTAGAVGIDPTKGLHVSQAVQMRKPAPLAPKEVVRLRASGRLSPRDHLRPATVELALAGGSHAEIAQVVVADVDLRQGHVRIGDRQVILDPFAISTLAARIAACRLSARRSRSPWQPASVSVGLSRALDTYPATSIAPSISSNLRRALNCAGLSGTGVRPASIREYAANRAYALTGRVESVAELLGLTSLDVARGFIDPAWQALYAEEMRAHARH